MSCDSVVPVCLYALLYITLANMVHLLHLPQQGLMELRLVNSDSNSLRNLRSWGIGLEPLVLLDLFHAKTEIWIRLKHVKDQVFYFLR